MKSKRSVRDASGAWGNSGKGSRSSGRAEGWWMLSDILDRIDHIPLHILTEIADLSQQRRWKVDQIGHQTPLLIGCCLHLHLRLSPFISLSVSLPFSWVVCTNATVYGIRIVGPHFWKPEHMLAGVIVAIQASFKSGENWYFVMTFPGCDCMNLWQAICQFCFSGLNTLISRGWDSCVVWGGRQNKMTSFSFAY